DKLVPDNIARFEVTGDDSFVFGLDGLPEIKLRMKDKVASSNVVLGAASDKLPFTLTEDINEVSDASATVKLSFEVSYNPMMAMMIKERISKFIETLAANMNKL